MNPRTLLPLLLASILVISFSSLAARETVAVTYRGAKTYEAKTMIADYPNITVYDAKMMIDQNPSLVILDVRNQSEYVTGHIRNAKLIPLYELGSRLSELNSSDEILVYCKFGGRSATACQILSSNGFSHIYNMLGGMTDWIRLEYPTYINYASIQEAINTATDGAAIYVGSGVYSEHLSVNKSIALVGENRDITTVDGTINGTIFYVTADNVSISDFNIIFCGCGCKGYSGIHLESNHQNVNITHNNLFANGMGILIVQAFGVIIADNNITYNTDTPINVTDSSDISVLENYLEGNFNGIEIKNTTGSTFSNNVLLNTVNGMSFTDSNNNAVFGNHVSSNVMYGFYLNQSNSNMFYHNNFIDNPVNILNRVSTNFWDNGLEGNFWSNYTGVDANPDGIGDTPHIIDQNNTDNCPLMGPFRNFHASANDTVEVVSNSSIDYFEYFQPSMLRMTVSNTTESQTSGFCRIRIPHNLIDPTNGSIQIFIDNGQTPITFLNTTLHDDGSCRWVYFSYSHSTREIVVVPEFPLFLLTPLLMAITILAATIHEKRRIKSR